MSIKLPFRHVVEFEDAQRNFEQIEQLWPITAAIRTPAAPAATVPRTVPWALGDDGHVYFWNGTTWVVKI